MCTARGCIDINPVKSIAQTLGSTRRSHAWLTSGFGVFAAAFPGFVIGYYTTQDGSLAIAGSVYFNVAAWMLASYLVTTLLVWIVNAGAARAMMLLAAVAAGLYYWFAADTITTAFDIQGLATVTIRVVALVLVSFWLWRAALGGNNGNSRRVSHVG